MTANIDSLDDWRQYLGTVAPKVMQAEVSVGAEPGDIIIERANNFMHRFFGICYLHAYLVAPEGDNLVLVSISERGRAGDVIPTPGRIFDLYRPQTNGAIRRAAAGHALTIVGKQCVWPGAEDAKRPFTLIKHVDCGMVVWWSYKQAGLILGDPFPTPDQLVWSSRLPLTLVASDLEIKEP